MRTIKNKSLNRIIEDNSSEIEFIPLSLENEDNIYFIMAGTVNGIDDPEYNDLKIPKLLLNTDKDYSLFDAFGDAFICKRKDLNSKVQNYKDLQSSNTKWVAFLLVWEIGLADEFGVTYDSRNNYILNDEGQVLDSYELYPDDTSTLVYNGILYDGKWIDNAFVKGFTALGPSHNITIQWEDIMREELNEVELVPVPKREMSDEEAAILYRIFYNEGVFEAIDYLEELGYDVWNFWSEINALAADPDFDEYDGYDGRELDLFYDTLEELEVIDKFDVEYGKEIHSGEPVEGGFVFEDIDKKEDEINFVDIRGELPPLTDISSQFKSMLEGLGFTNVVILEPIYKERQNAVWYSGRHFASAMYKDRFDINISATEMDSFFDRATEESIYSVQELEDLYGIYTDSDYYENVRYYEDDEGEVAYEFEPYLYISTYDTILNKYDVDEEFWWSSDTMYDISELNWGLDKEFTQFLDEYAAVNHLPSDTNNIQESKKDKKNILKHWKNKNKRTDKKGARGWFVNPNAGNVEYNVSFFNNAMSGGSEGVGDASSGMAEDLDTNLEEEVIVHDELNPKLWEGDKLKEEVVEKINLIVNTFTEDLKEDGINFEIEDVVIVGSNCSYNYNDASDLDVHIRAKSDSLDCPAELSTLLYGAYRNLFNKKFDIDFYGVDVELYVEDENSTVNSNGIYSINKKEWLKKPERTSIPDVDKDELNSELSKWEDEYNSIKLKAQESTEDFQHLEVVELITNFIEDIYDLRKLSIAEDGEYSIGNLVFKEFRAKGLLDEAKELKNEELSKAMSLKDGLKESLNLKRIDSIEKLLKLKELVDEDGTYSIEKGKLIKKNLNSGYMVSFFRPEITNKDIVRCREYIGKSLGEPYYGIYEGTPEISFNVDSKNFAMEIANIFNQVSIWDNAAQAEIKNPKFKKNKVVNYLDATNNLKHLLGVTETKKEKK